ncbi:hypothetical protein Droror1_Dr00008547 [Drosera rotundifolia]
MKIPKWGSWGWRNILQLWGLGQLQITWQVGDDKRIDLWHDHWSELGPLYLKVSNPFIYKTGLPRDVKLDQFIVAGVWKLPHPIQTLFQGHNLPQIHQGPGICHWKGRKKGAFNTAQAWSFFRPRAEVVCSYKLIWFARNIPRHSFISRLLIYETLSTHDRLMGLGITDHALCILCKKEKN